MNSIYIIVTALATTALAKGSIECNFSEPTAAGCFGAVGQLLIFHLPNTSNTDTRLKKDNQYIILKTEKNQIVIPHNEYGNRSELVTNGTLKLGYAMKKHSGDYVLEQFGSDGVSLRKVSVHLEIQAQVSKPAVSQMCFSPEQMNISCSSEGDGVEFILTLDGHILLQTRDHSQSQSSSTLDTLPLAGSTDNQHKPGVSVVTISLHGQLAGNLMCNVRNNVSKEQTVIHLTSCKGSISLFSLVIVVVIASVATLLALFLGIKHFNMKRPMTVNEDNAADEIVYSDVRVMKDTRKTGPNPHQNAT